MESNVSERTHDVAHCPIARLNTDALNLVFAALIETQWLFNQRLEMRAPLALSHVSRRWRSLALALPCLWSRIIWARGDSLDAACAFLERSRSALLTIQLSLPGDKEPGDRELIPEAVRDADRRDAEIVFHALLPHFWRASCLVILFSPETPSSSLLGPLLSLNEPCVMPNLRHLALRTIGGSVTQSPPRLNIACPPLESISLDYFLPRSWDVLLGPGTLALCLDLKDNPIQIGELRHALRLAPNLRSLRLPALTLVPDEHPAPFPDDENGALCAQLDEFYVYSFSFASMDLLRRLPIHLGQNTNVSIHTYRDVPFDLAYEYLRAGELVAITDMSVTAETLSFSTATGAERHVSAEKILVASLRDLFATTPILSTVIALTADFDLWPELVEVLAAARGPDSPCLPELNKLRLSVSYDEIDEEDATEAAEVPRVAILLPALMRVEIELRCRLLAPKSLVQRIACALAGLRAPGAMLLVDDVYCCLVDLDLQRFGELLREEMRNEGVPAPLIDFALLRRGQPVISCPEACS